MHKRTPHFHAFIASECKRRHWSLAEMARYLELSYSNFCRFMRGEQYMRQELLERSLDRLGGHISLKTEVQQNGERVLGEAVKGLETDPLGVGGAGSIGPQVIGPYQPPATTPNQATEAGCATIMGKEEGGGDGANKHMTVCQPSPLPIPQPDL